MTDLPPPLIPKPTTAARLGRIVGYGLAGLLAALAVVLIVGAIIVVARAVL